MKLMNLCVVALFVSMAAISSAHAQIDRVEKADIPFDFYAGNTVLPAGNYNIGLDVQNDSLNDHG